MKLNRRKFLAASGALGGAALVSSLVHGCGTAPAIRPSWPLQDEFEEDQASRARTIYLKNENPAGPSPLLRKELERWGRDVDFSRYDVCDFYLDRLRKSIAGYEEIVESQIFLGPGSRSVVAAALSRLRQRGSRRLVMAYPDYSQIEDYGKALGFKTVRLPFKRGTTDFPLEDFHAHDSRETVIYFSAPHLPYGTVISPDKLRSFLSSLKSAVVILDEAYVEFLREDFRAFSGKNLLAEFPRLIVVRTFSKMYALAGMRIGYAMVPPDLKQHYFFDDRFYRILNPLAASLAATSLGDKTHMEGSRRLVRASMSALLARAAKENSGVRVYPTQTNFYTVGIAYSAKNKLKHARGFMGEIWEPRNKFNYWAMDTHGEYQTTVSLQDEVKTIEGFDNLMKILRDIELI